MIAQVEDSVALSRRYHIINIENIPTTTELQLDCLYDSNEIAFQLRTARRGMVCVSFVWEGDRRLQGETKTHIENAKDD